MTKARLLADINKLVRRCRGEEGGLQQKENVPLRKKRRKFFLPFDQSILLEFVGDAISTEDYKYLHYTTPCFTAEDGCAGTRKIRHAETGVRALPAR